MLSMPPHIIATNTDIAVAAEFDDVQHSHGETSDATTEDGVDNGHCIGRSMLIPVKRPSNRMFSIHGTNDDSSQAFGNEQRSGKNLVNWQGFFSSGRSHQILVLADGYDVIVGVVS